MSSTEDKVRGTEGPEGVEIESWDDCAISLQLLRGIYAYGFENPSPIQKKAIPHILRGTDIVAQAQSGTGKTAAFAVGALALVNIGDNTTQVLVISPTRELTVQTANVITQLGVNMVGLRVQACHGGASSGEVSAGVATNNIFIASTRPVAHVVCGCPGRLLDMLRRGQLSCENLKIVVVDEADEMLSSEFKQQIYDIFQYIPERGVQVALFSATLSPALAPDVSRLTRDPVHIAVSREMLTLEGISQFYVALEDDQQKYLTLKDIFSFLTVSQCIIYCNTVRRVVHLYEAMLNNKFPVSCIHSDMDRNERKKAFDHFRTGKSRVLISSNLTARGIDIQQVSIVINFDLPRDVHTYLHRIGRSGRWGRKGVGINFITRRDVDKMREIESYYHCQVNELPADLTFLQAV